MENYKYDATAYTGCMKLKKDEELLRQFLGISKTPRHMVCGYGLTTMYASEEEAKQACRKHAAKLRKKFAAYLGTLSLMNGCEALELARMVKVFWHYKAETQDIRIWARDAMWYPAWVKEGEKAK